MGSLTQEVYVHWNEFASHFQEGFCELRESQELFDITLAASGSKQIRAHKVILSACSSFFRGLLRGISPTQHPLIYLKGIEFHHLESILSFIYNGEVKVQQGELESLLAVARELQIKGLTKNLSPETKQNATPSSSSTNARPPSNHSAGRKPHQHQQLRERVLKADFEDVLSEGEVDEDGDGNEIIIHEGKSVTGSPRSSGGGGGGLFPRRNPTHQEEEPDLEGEESFDDEDPATPLLHPMISTPFIDPANEENDDDGLERMMDIENEVMYNNQSNDTIKNMNYLAQKAGYTQALNTEISKCFDFNPELKRYQCKMCDYTSPRRDTMRSHVEAMHIITDGFECSICGKTYKTRNSLKTHKIRTHKRKLPVALL